jgi:hypothetical protein
VFVNSHKLFGCFLFAFDEKCESNAMDGWRRTITYLGYSNYIFNTIQNALAS